MNILYLASDIHAVGGIQNTSRMLIKLLSKKREVFLLELKRSNIAHKILFVLKFLYEGVVKKPDVIFCNHINFAPLARLAKKLRKTKYIVRTSGTEVWDIKSKVKLNALRDADIITAISEYSRDKILEQLPELKERIYMKYKFVDGEKFKPKPKSQELLRRHRLGDSRVILTVTRLWASERQKGYDKVIEALPSVQKAVPNVKYVLVGKGDDTPRIRQLVRDLGLESRVVLTGYVPDEELVDYYNFADVFIMPSKSEGFGQVYLQALACGKPVIAGNKDGSPTAVLNGELGLLVNPDSVEEITDALIKILTGRAPANIIDGSRLRKRVLEEYSVERYEERVLGIFSRLAAEK